MQVEHTKKVYLKKMQKYKFKIEKQMRNLRLNDTK